jgi:putative toxin-antitoxin system antitoxin component (TIGR02293 family)
MKTVRYSEKDKSVHQVQEPAIAYLQNEPVSPFAVHSILDVDLDEVSEPLRRVDTFRRGLSRKSFEKLKGVTGLDYHTLASALGVSSKTLQRKQVFDVIQSEKIYELAGLYALGMDYFGEDGFKRWMERPLFSIGNQRPIELIDVSEGIALLKTEIMRLQHGIAI